MIEERTQYRVRCDFCKTSLNDFEWDSNEQQLIEQAEELGWQVGPPVLCPECKKEAGKS